MLPPYLASTGNSAYVFAGRPKTECHCFNMFTTNLTQHARMQDTKPVYWEPSPAQEYSPKGSQRELVIKDQKDTIVLKDHVNTRFFIISDIHAKIFESEEVPKESAAADVMICCGDLTENSELHEYRKAINMLSKVTAPLKLVIAGNHDGTLDSQGFWDSDNWRYKSWPKTKHNKASQLFGREGQARRLLEREGFIVLDEGHHKFSLGNGAELKVYASPATPKRTSHYKAFQYKKGPKEGKVFDIDLDVDVAITHGPPRGILDPDPLDSKYRGCEILFNSIAKARPRLHCFGHNHGGWGVTVVGWKNEIGDEPPNIKETWIQAETELLCLKDIDPSEYAIDSFGKANGDRRKTELAATRCAPTSHCAGDEAFVEKGKQTLFVNASWSKIDKDGTGDYTQWPWLVDIELCRQRDNMDSANANGAVGMQALTGPQDVDEKSVVEKPSAVGHPLIVDQLSVAVKILSINENDDFELVSPGHRVVRKHSDSNRCPRGGGDPPLGGTTMKGIYNFQNPNRNIEDIGWRKNTTAAEQQEGDKADLKTPSTQSPPKWKAIGIGEQSSREQKAVNKRYGLSRDGRDTSGPWRQNRSGEESLKPLPRRSLPGRKAGN